MPKTVSVSTIRTNKRIKNIEKKVRKMEDEIELKWNDSNISLTIDPTPTAVQLLNGIGTGDDPTDDRIANEIILTSLQWRGYCFTNIDAIAAPAIRMMIILDRQPNGAAFTIGTLLDNSIISSNIFAPYNHNFYKRYKILYDELFTITQQTWNQYQENTTTHFTTVDAMTETNRIIQGKIPLNSYRVKYIDNGATIASIATGAVWALWITDQSSDGPLVNAGFRLYYKDP